jgi:Peptidase C65 Otubain
MGRSSLSTTLRNDVRWSHALVRNVSCDCVFLLVCVCVCVCVCNVGVKREDALFMDFNSPEVSNWIICYLRFLTSGWIQADAHKFLPFIGNGDASYVLSFAQSLVFFPCGVLGFPRALCCGVCVYVCMCMRMCMFVSVCLCVCESMCISVCMCVCLPLVGHGYHPSVVLSILERVLLQDMLVYFLVALSPSVAH